MKNVKKHEFNTQIDYTLAREEYCAKICATLEAIDREKITQLARRKKISTHPPAPVSVEPVGEVSAGTHVYWVDDNVPEPGTKLFTHPPVPSVPGGWTLAPNEPTEAMIQAGHVIARELIGANVAKYMNGLGEGKTWEKFKSTCKYPYLCEEYVNGDIDSTQAIYRAMLSAARSEK